VSSLSATQGSDVGQLVERQTFIYNSRRKELRQTGSIDGRLRHRYITISRDPGSLGSGVASQLASTLKWFVFDRQIVDYIARHAHVREEMVRELDEKAQSLVQDAVERLLRMAEGQSFGIEEYREGLLRTLATLSAQGGAIFLGHGAAFALRDEYGLRVRIMASRAVRPARLAERWNVPLDEARRRMLRMDADQNEFVRRHFRQDREDPRHYQMIFNTDHLSVDQVAGAILTVMGFAEASS
jgi:cytidylate kinase